MVKHILLSLAILALSTFAAFAQVGPSPVPAFQLPMTAGDCVKVAANGVQGADAGSPCAAPGGSSGQVQFNSSGVLGGSSGETCTATQCTLVSSILSGATTLPDGGSLTATSNTFDSSVSINGEASLSALGTGQLMLSDGTNPTKLTVSESTDSYSSRTSYADLTIDTGSLANTAIIGTNRGGTSLWGGNLEFQVLGSDVADYGVTKSNAWTFKGSYINLPDGLVQIGGTDTIDITSKLEVDGGGFLSNGTAGYIFAFGTNNSALTAFAGWNSTGVTLASGFAVGWSGISYGSNFNNATIDTQLVRKSAGVLEVGTTAPNDAGTIDATAYEAAGVAGANCSGSPSSSFAVSGGIVTHC